jgi:hypothetical protein
MSSQIINVKQNVKRLKVMGGSISLKVDVWNNAGPEVDSDRQITVRKYPAQMR